MIWKFDFKNTNENYLIYNSYVIVNNVHFPWDESILFMSHLWFIFEIDFHPA